MEDPVPQTGSVCGGNHIHDDSKKRKTRRPVSTEEEDIALLEAVASAQPHRADFGRIKRRWEDVACKVVAASGAQDLDGHTCRSRFESLIMRFVYKREIGKQWPENAELRAKLADAANDVKRRASEGSSDAKVAMAYRLMASSQPPQSLEALLETIASASSAPSITAAADSTDSATLQRVVTASEVAALVEELAELKRMEEESRDKSGKLQLELATLHETHRRDATWTTSKIKKMQATLASLETAHVAEREAQQECAKAVVATSRAHRRAMETELKTERAARRALEASVAAIQDQAAARERAQAKEISQLVTVTTDLQKTLTELQQFAITMADGEQQRLFALESKHAELETALQEERKKRTTWLLHTGTGDSSTLSTGASRATSSNEAGHVKNEDMNE